MTTLATLRTARLNVELGLSSDTDTGNEARFGTKAERNFALADAIGRLWPMCARLITEDVTITEGGVDYALTSILDVIAIEKVDTTLTVPRAIKDYTSWRSWVDESVAATPVSYLTLIGPMDYSRYSLKVIGYKPFTVPSVDADVLDIPTGLERVVSAGARAMLYLRRLNQFVDFERFANTDRATTLQPEQVLTMWQASMREYEDGMRMYQRGVTEPKIASFQRR